MEKCEKCGSKLEPDGICHSCTIKRGKKSARQIAKFAKKMTENRVKKK